MNLYTQLWIWFGVMFALIEGSALISKAPGATLSAHVRNWFSLREKSGGWIARRAGLAGFFGWLIYHFFFQ